ANGSVPDSACIWRGVFKIPPGSTLSLNADDVAGADAGMLRAKSRRWWSLADVAAAGRKSLLAQDDDLLVEELDDLLRLAVRERMIAD
ncbi:hypothetical protein, partial [Enterobacter cloacae]|uniref:hypothetical protein n=1 Tax=Enterobacter cloacae TaxID=550 RepID=UPI0019533460